MGRIVLVEFQSPDGFSQNYKMLIVREENHQLGIYQGLKLVNPSYMDAKDDRIVPADKNTRLVLPMQIEPDTIYLFNNAQIRMECGQYEPPTTLDEAIEKANTLACYGNNMLLSPIRSQLNDYETRKISEPELYEAIDCYARAVMTDPSKLASWIKMRDQIGQDQYSVANSLLIHAQYPDVVQIKNKKEWSKWGLKPRGDAYQYEHGIRILAPLADGKMGIRQVYDAAQMDLSQETLRILQDQRKKVYVTRKSTAVIESEQSKRAYDQMRAEYPTVPKSILRHEADVAISLAVMKNGLQPTMKFTHINAYTDSARQSYFIASMKRVTQTAEAVAERMEISEAIRSKKGKENEVMMYQGSAPIQVEQELTRLADMIMPAYTAIGKYDAAQPQHNREIVKDVIKELMRNPEEREGCLSELYNCKITEMNATASRQVKTAIRTLENYEEKLIETAANQFNRLYNARVQYNDQTKEVWVEPMKAKKDSSDHIHTLIEKKAGDLRTVTAREITVAVERVNIGLSPTSDNEQDLQRIPTSNISVNRRR